MGKAMASEPQNAAAVEAPEAPLSEVSPQPAAEEPQKQVEVRYRKPSLDDILGWFSVNEHLVEYYLGIDDERILRAAKAAEIASILAILKEMMGALSLTQRSKALRMLRRFYPSLRLEPKDKDEKPTRDLLKEAEEFGLSDDQITKMLEGMPGE
jgi:hypothetical protein